MHEPGTFAKQMHIDPMAGHTDGTIALMLGYQIFRHALGGRVAARVLAFSDRLGQRPTQEGALRRIHRVVPDEIKGHGTTIEGKVAKQQQR